MDKIDLGGFGHIEVDTKINLPPRDGIPYNFTGVVSEFWSNGELAEQSIYVRGRANGPFKSWYAGGTLAVDGFFSYGSRDSVWTFYDKSGHKTAEETYAMGMIKNTNKLTPEKEPLVKVPKMIVTKIEPAEGKDLQTKLKDFQKMLDDSEKQSKKDKSGLSKNGMKLTEVLEHLKDDPDFLESSEVGAALMDLDCNDNSNAANAGLGLMMGVEGWDDELYY